MKVKTIITYGTFDLFHVGHVKLLRRLRNLGDRLVVGLSSEEFNALKGKKTVIPYTQRAEILRSVRYVDDVFPEHCWEQKADDIRREKASILAMGDDWAGKFDHLDDIVEVVYLPRTEGISTTELKQVMTALQAERLEAVKHALEHVGNLVDELAKNSAS
jgi:glycerol-3-phosphate cytidylyltransferase